MYRHPLEHHCGLGPAAGQQRPVSEPSSTQWACTGNTATYDGPNHRVGRQAVMSALPSQVNLGVSTG